MDLSIVIPCYNEAAKIGRDIAAADRFVTSEKLDSEIIVVDDGSRDDTVDAARDAAGQAQTTCVIERLDANYGKGRAVRTGVLASRGDFVLFADSGLCIPFEDAKLGLAAIRSGDCRLAHGSRKLSNCHIVRGQSVYRKACSALFHWFLIHDIKRLGNLTDTQCGFKVYDGDTARALYAESTVDGFMFDVEIVLLALTKGWPIREFPVDWTCDPDSRLKPMHESIRVLSDLVRLKHRFGQFLKDNR